MAQVGHLTSPTMTPTAPAKTPPAGAKAPTADTKTAPAGATRPASNAMAQTDPLRDFELLIRSRYGIVLLETDEEDRAEALTAHAADRLHVPLFIWRRVSGLRRAGAPTGIYGTSHAVMALGHVLSSEIPAIYLFHGLAPDLETPEMADLLRETGERLVGRNGALVLTGAGLKLPEAMRSAVGPVHIPAPTLAEYQAVLQRVVRDVSARMRIQIDLSAADLERLLHNLQGLALADAEKLLTKALVEDGRLDAADLNHVSTAKKDLVERDGLLEYFASDQSLDDIADLRRLKEWLEKRQLFMTNPERAAAFGLEFPRGVLLAGVPGCGKSLCAKAVAAAWALPLVKLDPGALYNKYVGETEQNFRRAIASADRFAPMVLWIDEIEKAFAAGGAEDGGTSQRVLGTFLSWLQERRGDVFVVATANDIERLPPELVRKGRFDEIFFVDLPDAEARGTIFRIHLVRRKQDASHFDLARLAAASEGFSGAEIEQVVVSALYTAFAASKTLTTEALLTELAATPPTASTMREKIAFLREWAQGRTVPAN